MEVLGKPGTPFEPYDAGFWGRIWGRRIPGNQCPPEMGYLGGASSSEARLAAKRWTVGTRPKTKTHRVGKKEQFGREKDECLSCWKGIWEALHLAEPGRLFLVSQATSYDGRQAQEAHAGGVACTGLTFQRKRATRKRSWNPIQEDVCCKAIDLPVRPPFQKGNKGVYPNFGKRIRISRAQKTTPRSGGGGDVNLFCRKPSPSSNCGCFTSGSGKQPRDDPFQEAFGDGTNSQGG